MESIPGLWGLSMILVRMHNVRGVANREPEWQRESGAPAQRDKRQHEAAYQGTKPSPHQGD